MATQPIPPFWFRLRQGKMEPAGPDLYRLTAPNQAEAFIGIRSSANGRWVPVFRLNKDGPDLVESAEDLPTPQQAWEAAFEIYRRQVVV